MRLGLHFGALLFAHEADTNLDKVTNDLLDIAADITDFGELGGFNLDERRAGQLGEAARDFRLADTGRPDHENIFGMTSSRRLSSSCWRRQRCAAQSRPPVLHRADR